MIHFVQCYPLYTKGRLQKKRRKKEIIIDVFIVDLDYHTEFNIVKDHLCCLFKDSFPFRIILPSIFHLPLMPREKIVSVVIP